MTDFAVVKEQIPNKKEFFFVERVAENIEIFVVALSPFELRKRYIGTSLPHYTEMSHSSLNT